MPSPRNPFDIVKATDLTDGQIADYFVDFPGGASLLERINPRSPMPMFILGGKGSGKTHLMRYLSFPLQRRRAATPSHLLAEDRYIGVYFRCSGLNAQRFAGKRQSDEVWQALFAYYMELWLGQLVLSTALEFTRDSYFVPRLITEALRLLDVPPSEVPLSIEDLLTHLEGLQRAADVAINNCALTGKLDIKIQATSGRLVFGLPAVLAAAIPDLKDVLFVYLIDEFENLSEAQQRYVQTLVRERQPPCTFKIGVRPYGLRTQQTLSAGEENRENAEYVALRLDTELRERPEDAQLDFAVNLVRQRLRQADYVGGSHGSRLETWFENGPAESIGVELAERFRKTEPPYLAALHEKLSRGLSSGASSGLRNKQDVDGVIARLRTSDPIVERTSVFLLYRAWAKRQNLVGAAEAIAESAANYSESQASKENPHHDVLRHFRADIVAQLLKEARQQQRYLGFRTFVDMSAGLPRGLLTILKHIFTWSQFYGEAPFREGTISVRSQAEGVRQASEWFFNEARAPGPIGSEVRDAMTRLGQMLRAIRFSDKPSECSLSTISVELATTTERAREILRAAEEWSMLIKVAGGQVDRNDGRVDEKYQVHPMLAPRWDLPIARRGALALSGEEASAVFAPATIAEFESVLRRRVDAMNAPNFGRKTQGSLLPGLEDG